MFSINAGAQIALPERLPEPRQFSVPSTPKYDLNWAKDITASNLTAIKFPRNLIGNHDSLTTALDDGIRGMEKLQGEWRQEKHARQNRHFGLRLESFLKNYSLITLIFITCLNNFDPP